MLRVFICGGSGYTGSELLRILSNHDEVEVVGVTSEKSAGIRVSELFPSLFRYSNLIFEPLEVDKIKDRAELFFLALPHGTSQDVAKELISAGKRVVDLSADYRLKNPSLYEQWYKIPHRYPELLNQAVYGLPEVYRDRIREANLVANPGCYPTSVIIPLYPFLKNDLLDVDTIVVDSKSGVSGAGRKAELPLSFCEVNEDFRAYNVAKHRHTPEIEQELSFAAKRDIKIDFTTHLLPLNRGILTTIYAKLKKKITTSEALTIINQTYSDEPFIRVMEEGQLPSIKYVRGTNFCFIGAVVNKRTDRIILISSIDNLVKGASGQAVQNMNIMFNFDESKSLTGLALSP